MKYTKITQSIIRPEPFLKLANVKHLISFVTGTVIFCSGIGVTEWIPMTVRWVSGTLQTNWVLKSGAITNVTQFEIGVAEDGRLVWRPK